MSGRLKHNAATAARADGAWPGLVEDVIAALPDALVVVDRSARVRAANPAAEDLLGMSATALLGRPLGALVGFDAPLLALVERAERTATVCSAHDMPLRVPHGAVVDVDARAAPLGDDAGVVLLVRERSGARRLGEQVERLAAGRSLGGLAAVLAHEVRNPLAGIRGAAQLLERDGGTEGRDLARLIVAEADRIRALIDRMDALGAHGSARHGSVNVHEVLERVRRLVTTGVGDALTIVDRYDPSLPEVEGDRDRLIQLFLNLATNAAEAVAPKGGRIVLGTAYDPGRRLRGARLPIVVTVEDDGPGIAEVIRPRLFEPFATTGASGRGLGLALVAAIVAEHGGAIEVDSAPGRTVFRVALPAAGAAS